MTRSVSSKDEELLLEASLIVRCLSLTGHSVKSSNQNWNLPVVDYHSISRLLSTFMKDCRLVDGYLIGIVTSSERELSLQTTYHSWLTTPDNAIIDPWPMGIVSPGGAILIPTQKHTYNAHGSNLYYPDNNVREKFDVKNAWARAQTCRRILKNHCTEEIVGEAVDFISNL